MLPKDYFLPASLPIDKRDQLELNTKTKEASTDVFINYIICIIIDDPCWVERDKNPALLVDDPSHYIDSQEKARFPNARLFWVGTSRTALYGCS